MPRPRSENPRSATIRVRLTVDERARMETEAAAAGVSLSDLCRDRVLGVEQAPGGEPRPEARPVAQPAQAAPPAPAERHGGHHGQVVKLDKWLQGRTRMPAASCARMVARGLLTVDGVALREPEVELAALDGDVRLNGQKV